MNLHKIAQALNSLSLAIGELSEALNEQPEAATAHPPAPSVSAAPADLPPSFDELPPEWAEPADPMPAVLAATGGEEVLPREPQEGSLSSCPKHHVLYRDGRYGKYCPSVSDDPAWSNPKGFCKISPKNAAEYLRITAAA